MKKYSLTTIMTLLLITPLLFAGVKKDPLETALNGLKFRSLGPAVTSGRIADIAVDPTNPRRFFVAAASGGVWRTTNGGTTFSPVFDGQGSYSIGCVAIDPNDPLTVWVGTGENNSQRSVSYGDGVYKSIDGGQTWMHMGLKNSEHIAKILVDPRDSRVVYVAAQGPLWNDGGDRGLYKSTDGGRHWKSLIKLDKATGVTDIAFDPRNPDIIYAASYQRRRHVWVLIDGGPGSAIYKTDDAGKNWRKLTNGLPKGDMGRIGLAVSPVSPNTVYAIVEAGPKEKGFYRSQDGGINWKKQSGYVSGSPQYYQEIIADPRDAGRVYAMDTWMMVTDDGGKSWKKVGEKAKHVDNHALWIDPHHPQNMLAGCDGGLYETYDRGATWRFFPNLPITQFYHVTADNAAPFYNVYGGTQDNATLGGPAQNTSINGIRNSDWFVTVFGDGFKTVVDPENPNIIYSQYQYGGLVRYDKRNGEMVSIQPQPDKDAEALRWNWNAPIIISPHSHTRIYFGANILFKSEDRGNSWTAVSGDLTRHLDRNKLKVMGRVWGPDAIAKNTSTSFYGEIIALDESPLQEGLLVAGTDDGLIRISSDGGKNWRKSVRFPGVPEMSYVSDVLASLHDKNIIYATFDNHKKGDYRPYVLKSADGGKSWHSIASNLPKKGTVYSIAQDHVDAQLLFVGTEYGVFFSNNEGRSWHQLKGGLPTIAVRDIDIQRRENDLLLATFGRGFYVLDDYSPLRFTDKGGLKSEARLFPVKNALMYIENAPLGLPGKAFQGDAYFTAKNPPFGARFTYFLKKGFKTLKEQRHQKEAKEKDVKYPSWEALKKEQREQAPQIVLTIRDADGQVVRRLTGPATAGLHRVAWDLRFPAANPVDLKKKTNESPWDIAPAGPRVAPGKFTVQMALWHNGVFRALGDPQSFECVPLKNSTLPQANREEVLAFQQKTARLQRVMFGAQNRLSEIIRSVKFIQKGLFDTPAKTLALRQRLHALRGKLADLKERFTGNTVIRSHSEPVPPSMTGRLQEVIDGAWASTAEITATHKKNYRIAKTEFDAAYARLLQLQDEWRALLHDADKQGMPAVPGELPAIDLK